MQWFKGDLVSLWYFDVLAYLYKNLFCSHWLNSFVTRLFFSTSGDIQNSADHRYWLVVVLLVVGFSFFCLISLEYTLYWVELIITVLNVLNITHLTSHSIINKEEISTYKNIYSKYILWIKKKYNKLFVQNKYKRYKR